MPVKLKSVISASVHAVASDVHAVDSKGGARRSDTSRRGYFAARRFATASYISTARSRCTA